MCNLQDVPSSFYVPLPWKEPLYWLVFAVILALAIVGLGVGLHVQRRLESELTGSQSMRWLGRLGVGLIVVAGVTMVTGGVLGVLIWLPTSVRQGMWYAAESARLQAHACGLHALFATDDRLSAAITPIALASVICVVIVWLLLMAIATWGIVVVFKVRSHRSVASRVG